MILSGLFIDFGSLLCPDVAALWRTAHNDGVPHDTRPDRRWGMCKQAIAGVVAGRSETPDQIAERQFG
jgi:hypothetical protein